MHKSVMNEKSRHKVYKSQMFSTSACGDGTLKNQDGNDTTTHLHHPYILCHFANYDFFNCVHSRVVEGSWEGIAGCVVHVDVCGECLVACY